MVSDIAVAQWVCDKNQRIAITEKGSSAKPCPAALCWLRGG